jgi:hypothetical protein
MPRSVRNPPASVMLSPILASTSRRLPRATPAARSARMRAITAGLKAGCDASTSGGGAVAPRRTGVDGRGRAAVDGRRAVVDRSDARVARGHARVARRHARVDGRWDAGVERLGIARVEGWLHARVGGQWRSRVLGQRAVVWVAQVVSGWVARVARGGAGVEADDGVIPGADATRERCGETQGHERGRHRAQRPRRKHDLSVAPRRRGAQCLPSAPAQPGARPASRPRIQRRWRSPVRPT